MRYDVVVLFGGLVGYLVSILASSALIVLSYRLNRYLLPGVSVTALLRKRSPSESVAPAIAIGAATLCQAILLRHGVFAAITIVRAFLSAYGNQLLTEGVPFIPLSKMVVITVANVAILSALSVLSLWFAGKVFDLVTADISELEEIAKGNVSIAIFFAFVLLATTIVLDQGVEGLARALIPPGATVMSLP